MDFLKFKTFSSCFGSISSGAAGNLEKPPKGDGILSGRI